MAGRRGSKQVVKSDNNSLMMYIPMVAVLIVLAMTLYTFGIDFGFVSFGGNPNVNVLYGGAAACVVASFITDIMFIKAIKKLYKRKSSFMDYVPFFNTTTIFTKNAKYFSIAIAVVMFGVALTAYTPLGQFLPVDYLLFTATNSVVVIIIAIGVYAIVRGIQCLKIKSSIDRFYKEKINDSYGSGGAMSFVAYIIYFLPIIRAISLFTDINFINSVRLEAQEMHKREERRK